MNWFPGTSIEYELAQVKLGIKLYKRWVRRTQKIIRKLNNDNTLKEWWVV